MVKSKPSCPPEGNELNILTYGNKGKPPIPISTEVINLKTIKALILNPRRTSRVSKLTCKATYLTFGQEHPTNLPEQ